MGIVAFFLIALIAAGVIAYPLVQSRTGSSEPAKPPAVRDGDIERAVDRVRRARSRGELACPACGRAYQAGDRFCVACGHDLSEDKSPSTGSSCPSCGAQVREEDQFCAKCGHQIAAEEAA